MCFSFVGCDKGEPSIVGVWKGTETADFAKLIANGDAQSQEVFEHVDFDDSYKINVTYTLNADGTYEMVADEKSVQDFLKDVLQDIMGGVEEYFKETAEAASMTPDQLAQAVNYDSFEGMLYEMEGLMEASVKEALGREKLKESGTYTVADDQSTIEFTDKDTKEPEEATILKFTAAKLKLSTDGGAVVVDLTK
jgi:hypothetical protein